MLNETTLYRYSMLEAKEENKLQEWRDSYKANCACCHAIEAAIRRDFDGMHLADGCAESVIEEFGYKRIEYVLANTLQEKSFDGRFSSSNKEWGRQFYVPKDDAHNYCFSVGSHPAVLDGFINDFRKAYQQLGLLDAESCVKEPAMQDFTNQILVMKPRSLSEDYWAAKYQLWLGRTGFGCEPGKLGTAVYATCLYDGETSRWSRSDFIGPIKPECLPKWATEQLEKLKAGQEITPPEQIQEMTL